VVSDDAEATSKVATDAQARWASQPLVRRLFRDPDAPVLDVPTIVVVERQADKH
jgi:hypothetical protein